MTGPDAAAAAEMNRLNFGSDRVPATDSRSFLSRVSTLTRLIHTAIRSVHPSIRDVPVLDENGLT